MADLDILVRSVKVATSDTSATVPVASDPATRANDYLLVLASVDYKNATSDLSIAAATGVSAWTQIVQSDSGTTELSKAWIGKVSSDGAKTAVPSQNSSGSGLHVQVYTLNPSGGTISIDGTPTAINDPTSPYPQTAFTVAGTKDMLVCYHAQVQFNGVTLAYGAAPSGFIGTATYHNEFSGIQSCYKMLTGSGSTGSPTQTSNVPNSAAGGVGAMFALRSQGTAASGPEAGRFFIAY